VQRSPISTSTIPAAASDPTDRYVYLSREEAAKKLFKKLVKQLIETGQPPEQDRADELNTYSDVMTADKVFEWKYAEGLRGGILWDDDTCSLMFIEVPRELHDAISSAVLDQIKDQFPGGILKTRGSASELSPRFTLTPTGLATPGVGHKEPDQSLRPRIYDPTNNPAIPIMATTGKPWPTVVIEVGVSESTDSIRSRRQLYLNHLTGVNIYIGVAYNRNQTRATDTWYCCIATGDTAPPNPPPANPGRDWPPFKTIYQSVYDDKKRFPKLQDAVSAPTTYQIESRLIWYPEPRPAGQPAHFTIDLEALRLEVIEDVPP
jgi:hypothetical protein